MVKYKSTDEEKRMLGDFKSQLKRTELYKVYKKLKLDVVYWKVRNKVHSWLLAQEGKWFPAFIAKRIYKKRLGKKLNLDNTQALAEKICWLKLSYYPKNPLAILVGDKRGLHAFLEERGLSRIAPSLLHVFD
jgi:hypothetical protein